jgi:putative transposase
MTAFRVPASAGRLIYQDISEMYYYRNLSPEQQNEVVVYRRQQRRPWHSPPHWNFEGERQFFISGTCFEHDQVIGVSHERMTECENALLEVCGNYAGVIYAWCILPNHYHILVKTDQVKELRKEIGRFHQMERRRTAPRATGLA